uniref:Uncharacterized protein n=1 Tax=Arundo donax TaxID=35708 RepID=A0A0A9HR38_ARUDO
MAPPPEHARAEPRCQHLRPRLRLPFRRRRAPPCPRRPAAVLRHQIWSGRQRLPRHCIARCVR